MASMSRWLVWLVHYEEVRLGRQHHCQRHSLHLPAREILHQTVRTESETGDELLDSQLVSEQGIIVQPLRELPARLQNLSEDVIVRRERELLLQECYPDMFQEGDFSSGVRLVIPREYSQQCGFACSVRCNEGDLVTLIDIEPDMLEQHFRSITLADVFYL